MNYFQLGGLVTNNDPNTENCNLFYSEYLTLKGNTTNEDVSYFKLGMELKWNHIQGCYNRRLYNDERSVSNDEITGWLVSSKILGTDYGKQIWNHLITHWGSYNNTGRLLDYLPFNLGNYYAWGKLVNSPLAYLFMPVFALNLLISCYKPKEDTSTKLLYWVQLSNIKSPMFTLIFKYFMVKMYGESWLTELLMIYFGRTEIEDFPIFMLLRGKND